MAVQIPDHHKRNEVCVTRSRYRQGRKDTAVKVYTIAQESTYLLVLGVPALNLDNELKNACEAYGEVVQCRSLRDYPREEFTDVFLIQYRNLSSAKFMKKKLDDKTFFGGSLHVCYAPEFESVQDTREKLQWRRRQVSMKTSQSGDSQHVHKGRGFRQHLQTPNDETVASNTGSGSYIWAGKEYPVEEPSENKNEGIRKSQTSNPVKNTTASFFVPRQVSSVTRNCNHHPSVQMSKNSRDSTEHTSQGSTDSTQTDPVSSYDNTIALIRKRMSSYTAPNVDVSFKRKKP